MNDSLSETKEHNRTVALNPAKTTKMLLRLIRAVQPISRIDTTRQLDINRNTVTEIVKSLISAGIVREDVIQTAAQNRPQGRLLIGLYFNDKDGFFVGLNLGVWHTQVGLVTITGEVLAEEEFETLSEPEIALKTARAKIETLCAEIENRTLQTIGISVPVPTDETRRNSAGLMSPSPMLWLL